MAPTLLTATYQEPAQDLGSQQINEQVPLLGGTAFEIKDST